MLLVGLIAAALALAAGPAAADPLTAAAAAIATWYGSQTLLVQALVQLGASAVIGTAAQAIAGQRARPRATDIARELGRETSTPQNRSVYGWHRVTGTPAPWLSKDRRLFGCLLLNSRPSHGNFTVYLDKRPLVLSGDVYDFGPGGGAVATNGKLADHVRVWINRGDHVGPPADILAEAPELFIATDEWRGMTVIWLRLRAGDADELTKRWPSPRPHVEVEGEWSLVWDPRNPSAPPAYSANQALCALDALRNNPVRPYPDAHLLLDHWIAGADIADELVARADGTLERRYAVGCVLVWTDAEVEDQVDPLVAAGAGRFTRVSGQLGYVPGAWVEPTMTIRDVLEEGGLDYRRWAPSDDLPTSVSVSYTSAARGFEDADLGVWPIPGALEADGGLDRPMTLDLTPVTSATQAQRVRQIEARRARMQRQLKCTLPPAAFDLIGGSTAPVDLPAPYARANGLYTVDHIDPGFDPVGEEGVAMRCPVVLKETSPWVYAWDPATDEEPVAVAPPVDTEPKDVPPPGAVAVAVVTLAGQPALRWSCAPSPSGYATAYAWEYQVAGGPWRVGGSVADDMLDAAGDVWDVLRAVELRQSHRVRVRTLTVQGQRSAWVTSASIVVAPLASLAPPPARVSAVGGVGQIVATFRAPNDRNYRAMEIYASATNNPVSAALIHGPVYGAAGGEVSVTIGSLAAGARLYFWARSLDQYDAPSALSSPALTAVAS